MQLSGSELPDLHGDAAEPIHHGGELLGALSILKRKGDPVAPYDRRLLEDVAAGAGLLVRNIWLNAELADRAEELRFSRRRLVAAQDLERRRLERNLHDGAQQQVVALKVKLALATTLARREGMEQVADAVGELADDSQRADDGMRAAARGIYPPLLEAEGLRTALVAAGRQGSTRVHVEADGIGRYPPEIEATVYFCVLEAIGHTAADAPDQVRVSLDDNGQVLTFSVDEVDAGSGPGRGITAIADRLEAVGGTLNVRVTPECRIGGHRSPAGQSVGALVTGARAPKPPTSEPAEGTTAATKHGRTLIRLGRLLTGASVTVALISMGILAALGRWDFFIDTFVVHNGLIAVGFGSLAWVTLATQAHNRAVWALAWSAFFGALFTAGVAAFVLTIRASIPELTIEATSVLSPADLPLSVTIALQPVAWAWIPAFFVVLTLGLLLFPDGRPPTPRWRWVGWCSVATIALAVAPWV